MRQAHASCVRLLLGICRTVRILSSNLAIDAAARQAAAVPDVSL